MVFLLYLNLVDSKMILWYYNPISHFPSLNCLSLLLTLTTPLSVNTLIFNSTHKNMLNFHRTGPHGSNGLS